MDIRLLEKELISTSIVIIIISIITIIIIIVIVIITVRGWTLDIESKLISKKVLSLPLPSCTITITITITIDPFHGSWGN